MATAEYLVDHDDGVTIEANIDGIGDHWPAETGTEPPGHVTVRIGEAEQNQIGRFGFA